MKADRDIAIILDAMRTLETSVAINNVRCVQFRPRINNEEYYIVIVNGSGCSSYVSISAEINLISRWSLFQFRFCSADW